jgi:hypothetical protein
MEPITPLSSPPVLGSSTSGAGGQQQNPHLMQEGQTVNAFVTGAKGHIFAQNASANRPPTQADSVTLSPGQSLKNQATTTSSQLDPNTITIPSLQQRIGQSLPFIGKPLDLSPLLQILSQQPNPALESLSATNSKVLTNFLALQQPPVPGKEGGKALRQMIDTLGLNMEARLGQNIKNDAPDTLKSALLEVLHRFEESETIQKAGKSLLSIIESFQFSQLRLELDKTIILPLPFPFLDQGYLLIDQQQKQESEQQQHKKSLHFSLHLALTGLGNIQIEFLQTDDGLWMRFNCDSQEKADFVGEYREELKGQLEDIPLQGLSFAGTANAPGADLIRMLVPEGQSLLNTKV